MSLPDLIAELERIDATATKGPWEAHGKMIYNPLVPVAEFNGPYEQAGENEQTAHAIAFLRNHAGQIAEMVRVQQVAIEHAKEALEKVLSPMKVFLEQSKSYISDGDYDMDGIIAG